MIDVACLIIGIGGWEQYTQPLIESIHVHEPLARVVVIDNDSINPYPHKPYIHRTLRLSYASAIMHAKEIAGDSDWTVVLSNDVLCTGAFVRTLAETPERTVIGPRLTENGGWHYIEGWCVCASRRAWADVGGWDTRFLVSSWEDVDFSVSATRKGYQIAQVPLPFTHLDQRQRFHLVENYWDSEAHNIRLMHEKHGDTAHWGLE